MSKDMLGPIVRALVGVPHEHHGVILDLVNKFGGDNVDDLRKRVAQALREPAAPKKSVMNFRVEVSVGPLTKQFKRREFFRTRKGRYLWDDMERVLGNTHDAEPTAAATKLKFFDLTKDAYDREIKAELSESHEVELWQVAELIDRQKNGEEGALLNNGYANIFYIAGFAVSVLWFADYRRWSVNYWELDDVFWRRGYRVFSSN